MDKERHNLNGLPWHIVETDIQEEISWLKGSIAISPSNNSLSSKSKYNPSCLCF